MSFKEKDFQREFTQAIGIWTSRLAKHIVYHKISDMSMDKKPCDCFLLIDAHCKMMELKIHKRETAWPFSKVEPHQKKALDNAILSGNQGYVIINIRIPGAGTTLKENWVAIFSYEHIFFLEQIAKRKSLTLEVIKQKADYLVRKDKGYWNLEDFLLGKKRLITSGGL